MFVLFVCGVLLRYRISTLDMAHNESQQKHTRRPVKNTCRVEPPFAVDDFCLASSLLTLASSCARWGGDFVGRLGLAPRAVWLVGKGF